MKTVPEYKQIRRDVIALWKDYKTLAKYKNISPMTDGAPYQKSSYVLWTSRSGLLKTPEMSSHDIIELEERALHNLKTIIDAITHINTHAAFKALGFSVLASILVTEGGSFCEPGFNFIVEGSGGNIVMVHNFQNARQILDILDRMKNALDTCLPVGPLVPWDILRTRKNGTTNHVSIKAWSENSAMLVFLVKYLELRIPEGESYQISGVGP